MIAWSRRVDGFAIVARAAVVFGGRTKIVGAVLYRLPFLPTFAETWKGANTCSSGEHASRRDGTCYDGRLTMSPLVRCSRQPETTYGSLPQSEFAILRARTVTQQASAPLAIRILNHITLTVGRRAAVAQVIKAAFGEQKRTALRGWRLQPLRRRGWRGRRGLRRRGLQRRWRLLLGGRRGRRLVRRR